MLTGFAGSGWYGGMKSLQRQLAGMGQTAVIALVAVILIALGAIFIEMRAAPGGSAHTAVAKESGGKDSKKKKKKKHSKSSGAPGAVAEKDDEPEEKK